MAREAYLSFPEFPLTSLRKQKRCCFSVFTYLVSSKWRTYHNDRSSGRYDFIRRKRYLARWTHRPLWHNRDKLKNTEITKQTGWHECQYVFIQCRNSSRTDWDFSGPALRRKLDPGKRITLFNLIASVYMRKKLTHSLARTKSWQQRSRMLWFSYSVFERRTSTGSGPFASLGSGLVETLG